MVFSTTTLFKGIQCPEGERCGLTSCIFAHHLRPQDVRVSATQSANIVQSNNVSNPSHDGQPASKRRRVTSDQECEDRTSGRAESVHKLRKPTKESSPNTVATLSQSEKSRTAKSSLPSLLRSVSPPLKTNAPAANIKDRNNPTTESSKLPTTSKAQATLNPRLIPNDPAGHAKRSLILRHLHAEMVRLNQAVSDRTDVKFKEGVILQGTEVIQLTLDEEEKVAREQGSVYGNVIKNRIAAYKKMKLDDWITHLKTTPLYVNKYSVVKPVVRGSDPPKPIGTGLSCPEEVAILSHLVISDQKSLAKFGYVPIPPTGSQAEEAAAAVTASANYELCDRCTARFQAFPNRDDAGLLTTNGPCRYHPNRKVHPQRTKADTGPREPYYPCCNENVGSRGCTMSEHHVFKASSPARLAAVLPFITTPENESPSSKEINAVSFDCEMGYTTLGLELIRLTAVSWPEGEELVDVLVRPLGIVLDLNSRFSGVWPEHFANAIPYSSIHTTTSQPPTAVDGSADTTAPPLPVVSSPQEARNALCAFLTPTTPLIGHAIENDLNVVRLCHPTIIDTVVLFPHPRGLPWRHGLRALSSKHLHRSIQTGGERGHDSAEDARATGDLVRVKVGEKWKVLRATGWRFVDGRLTSPATLKAGEVEAK